MVRFACAQIVAAIVWPFMENLDAFSASVIYSCIPLLTFLLLNVDQSKVQTIRKVLPSGDFTIHADFVRFVVAIFILRLLTNLVRGYLSIEAATYDATGISLFKLTLNVMLLLYAYSITDKVNIGMMCYGVILAVSGVIVTLPVVEGQRQLASSLVGALSGFSGNIAALLFASICYSRKDPPAVVFGVGYGCAYLASSLSWELTMHYGDLVHRVGLSQQYAVPIAYLVLIAAVIVCPPSVMQRFTTRVPRRSDRDARGVYTPASLEAMKQKHSLTNREVEVLAMLLNGYDARYISERFSVSINTTRSHVKSLYTKLDVHSKSELQLLVESSLEIPDSA